MREIEIKRGDEVVSVCYSISDAIDEITGWTRRGVSTHAHLGTVYQSSRGKAK